MIRIKLLFALILILSGVVIISYAIYNISFKKEKIKEPNYIEQQSPQETTAYYPALGDSIGTLKIPVLSQEMPIIEGTGADQLEVGVGHFVQSVMPGVEDNCVFSGHRDTFFSRLGELKIGDKLIVTTSIDTYTYQIQNIRIVEKDDRTVIVPTDFAALTLTTCYPFNYFGSAPQRYIVTAYLIPTEDPS